MMRFQKVIGLELTASNPQSKIRIHTDNSKDWTKRGGIVGRGILIDYVSWATEKKIPFNPMSQYPITLDVIKQYMKERNIVPRPGDILLVRSGWIKWYEEHTQEERIEFCSNGSAWIGVEGSEESLSWLWDNHFAAVAGDAIGFECWPPKDPWSMLPRGLESSKTDENSEMHDFLLAGWGMPIGEMWDLEALSEECKRQKRWSFFLTSAPLNLKGGAASPPNALAIF